MTLAITRMDLTAEDLRRAARSSRDVAQARRCLALALVLEGRDRTEAAQSAGMQRQTPLIAVPPRPFDERQERLKPVARQARGSLMP